MEPQVTIYTPCCRRERRCCVDIVIFILSVLLALTIGLIIGALPSIGTILLHAVPALIVLSIILLLGIIIRAIELRCNNRCNTRRRECC